MKAIKSGFLAVAILLNFLFPIHCSGQTDTSKWKFCYSSEQMNYWIGSAFDASTYKTAVDSLNKVVSNLNMVIQRDSVQAYTASEVLKAKNETIKASDKLSDEYREDLETESKWRKFWRGSTFITGGVAAGVIIFQYLKP